MDSIIRKWVMKLKNSGGFLIAPSSSLRDEIEIQRGRLRLALQPALVVLFLISDALSLTVLGGALPIGMTLILAVAHLIGRTKYVRISSTIPLGAISILPFIVSRTILDTRALYPQETALGGLCEVR